jgi:hypothetical protein
MSTHPSTISTTGRRRFPVGAYEFGRASRYNGRVSAGGNKWARARADFWPLAGLGVLIFIPFIVRAVMGRSALSLPLMHDVGFQWVPFRAFMARALDAGMFPLWAPEVFAGFPFAAFSHTGVFYPPGWLLLIGDYARAVNFFYPLHLMIAATGVYALGRSMGLSRLAAWLAALSYVLTGKPYYFIHFLPATCSNVWAPWLLVGAMGLLRGGGGRYFFLAAASLGLELAGGDVESTSYALLFSGLFVALMAGPLGLRLARAPLLLAALVLGVALAAVQVLPLAEYSRHFARSQGVTLAYFRSRELPASMIWAALLPLGGARYRPGQVLDAPYFYLGALTVGLAVAAGLRRVGAGSGRLLALAGLAGLWSFGSIPVLDHLQYALPVLRSFGSPEQAYFVTQLLLVLLAGQAVDAAAAGPARTTMFIGAAALAFGACRVGATLVGVELLPAPWSLLVIALALMAYGLVQCGRKAPWGPRALVVAIAVFQVVDLYALAFLYLPSTRPDAVAYPEWLLRLAPRLSPAQGRTMMVSREGLTDPELFYHAGLALGFDAIDGWITVPPRDYAEFLALADPRAARFVGGKLDHLGLNAELRDGRFIDAGSMPLLDLLSLRFIVDRGLRLKFGSPSALFLSPPEFRKRTLRPGLPSIFAAEQDDASTPAGFTAAPSHDESTYRLFITAGDRLRLAVPKLASRSQPGAACALTVEAIAGATAEPLTGMTIAAAAAPGAVSEAGQVPLDRWAGREIGLRFALDCPDAPPDLAIAWPSPVIVNPGKPLQGVEAGPDRPDLLVYRNREALPRAWVAHEAVTARDPEDELAQLKRATREELGRKVWLRSDAGSYRGGGAVGTGEDRAVMVSRRPGEEVYEVESRGPGLLLIADQYYPGWRASVRGHEAAVLRADHCLRAVPVPEGKSTVKLAFVPASFRVGLSLSLVTLLAGAGARAGFRRKRGR